jgi:hypothetical protein
MFSGKGQINMDSELGKEIFNICSKDKIRNIFEVGTWNGEGSTVCVMNAIIYKPFSTLYSLESSDQQYQHAVSFWKNKNTNKKLILLKGILHKECLNESVMIEECRGTTLFVHEWYAGEKAQLESNLVIDINPIEDIDVIILDGGEYTTMGDYNTLIKKQPNVIILDDTNVYKCKAIRKQLLEDPEWILYKENTGDRHGWSIFIRKSYTI